METVAFIIVAVMTAFALAGVADRVFLKNRLGLGPEFDRGIGVIAPLCLSMTGIICLVPLLKMVCSYTAAKLFIFLGLDPSAAAGMLDAIDMGGFFLAQSLAENEQIGLWSGVITASMTGTAVIFTIPVGFAAVCPQRREPFMKGLLCGLAACPLGELLGGALLGLETKALVLNTLPAAAFSLVIILCLRFSPGRTVRVFSAFAKGAGALAYIGLGLGILRETVLTEPESYGTVLKTAAELISPAGEGIKVAGSIAVLLAGAFPMVTCLKKLLTRPLAGVGKRLGMSERGVAGLLMSAVNNIAVFSDMEYMTGRETLLNAAFTVCAAFALGDHLAFAAAVAPQAAFAMVVSKLFAGIAGLIIALPFAPRTSAEDEGSECT